jgi:hypothetical protein
MSELRKTEMIAPGKQITFMAPGAFHFGDGIKL